jgi:OOP family OmpA-OmpF porin
MLNDLEDFKICGLSRRQLMKKGNKKMIPLAVAAAMALGSSASMAGPKGYAADATDDVVVSGFGECWRSVDGPKMPPIEKCGDAMPMAEEPAPAPAPPPAPVDGDDDGDGVPNSRDNCPGTRAGAAVDADGCEIVENLTINLLVEEFDFDSARLKPEMKAALRDLAERIKATPGHEKITIIGHTDSVGSEAYNMKLSLRRAEAAAEFLRSLGIDDITTEGRGESEPIASNATPEGRAMNRRIEIQTH